MSPSRAWKLSRNAHACTWVSFKLRFFLCVSSSRSTTTFLSRTHKEHYTAILSSGVNNGKEKLEKYYNKKIIIADREMVEQNAYSIIDGADQEDVGFLVVGDALWSAHTISRFTHSQNPTLRSLFIANTARPHTQTSFIAPWRKRSRTKSSTMHRS